MAPPPNPPPPRPIALGLGRQSRTCLVISHKQYRNDGIEASHAVLGHDHVHPQTILATARKQIERYGNTSYAEAEIVAVQKEKLESWKNHSGFTVTSSDGRTFTGKTLVLATGVRDIFPDFPGYASNWPRNIYQCLFCDGWERRESEKAILCYPEVGMHDAKTASMALGLDASRNADGSAKVTILTNGPWDETKADLALAKQVRAVQARGVNLDQRRVIKLENAESEGKDGVYVYLQAESGKVERVFFGFIFHKPSTELNAQHLVSQLGLETEPGMSGPVIKTQWPMYSATVNGVFVAGDSGNAMTHVTIAMTSGVGAAGGVTFYLNGVDDEDALAEIGKEEAVINGPDNGTECGVEA